MTRIILSLLAIAVYGLLSGLWTPIATLFTAQIAGGQFDNSNTAYLQSAFGLHLFNAAGVFAAFGLFVILLTIWIGPLRRLAVEFKKELGVLFLCAIFGGVHVDKALAFAETTDKTEAYTILPNESAFWIPDAGANKDTQTKLDSEDYLNANKIAAKRFIIPHAKLTGSGGTSLLSGWDYYIPTGRLIIVDRTPYSREWVGQTHRGTSQRDESFPCQSSEGLNVSVGVSIGASVLEANAAKYLYRFGVTAPKGDRKDPQVIFTSVYYGRAVSDVMDDVGRKKVQTLVCDEISARSLDKANLDAPIIMAAVIKKATDYFAAVGVTIDFLGWADTFSFDAGVQKALNDKYAADKLRDALPVLAAVAQLHVQEGLGLGLANKGLPIVVTPDMINTLIGLVKPAVSAPSN